MAPYSKKINLSKLNIRNSRKRFNFEVRLKF